MIEVLKEAKDLNIYKKLLRILADYSDRFPGTSVTKMFRRVVSKGLKVLPKDKRALFILDGILKKGNVPSVVNSLLNLRFTDLSVEDGKPLYKDGRSRAVAFWAKDGKVYDRVISLLNLDDDKNVGWTDMNGEKVSLVDLVSTE